MSSHSCLPLYDRVTGVLAIRIRVSGKTGSVVGISALTDTLVADPSAPEFDEEGMEIDVSG